MKEKRKICWNNIIIYNKKKYTKSAKIAKILAYRITNRRLYIFATLFLATTQCPVIFRLKTHCRTFVQHSGGKSIITIILCLLGAFTPPFHIDMSSKNPLVYKPTGTKQTLYITYIPKTREKKKTNLTFALGWGSIVVSTHLVRGSPYYKIPLFSNPKMHGHNFWISYVI